MFGELVVIGVVSDVVERSGVTRNEERRPWRMVSAFIPGRRGAYEVQISEDLESVVVEGAEVALTVRPRVYRGEVSFEALGLWDGAVPAPARSAA